MTYAAEFDRIQPQVFNTLFPPPRVSGNSSHLKQFQVATKQFLDEPSFPNLLLTCIRSRLAFESVSCRKDFEGDWSDAEDVIRFIRLSNGIIRCAEGVAFQLDDERLALRKAQYLKSIQRRANWLSRELLTHEGGPRRKRGARYDDTELEHPSSYWLLLCIWTLRSAITLLGNEVQNEAGPWALSANDHLGYLRGRIRLVRWMLSNQIAVVIDERFSTAVDQLTSVCQRLEKEAVAPLVEITERLEKQLARQNTDVTEPSLEELIRGDFVFGGASQDLDNEAEALIRSIGEGVLPRTTSECEAILETLGELGVDVPEVFSLCHGDRPRFYGEIYRQYCLHSSPRQRAEDETNTVDLRYNAVLEWLKSDSLAAADYVVHELGGFQFQETFSNWQIATLFLAESCVPNSEVDRQGLRQKTMEAANFILATPTETESLKRLLLSCVRTTTKFSTQDNVAELQRFFCTPSWKLDVRYAVIRSMVDWVAAKPERRLSESVRSLGCRLFEIGKTCLDRNVFQSGPIAGTAMAIITILVAIDDERFEELLACVEELDRKWLVKQTAMGLRHANKKLGYSAMKEVADRLWPC